MSPRAITHGFRRLFRRTDVEQELNDEVAQYLEAAADEYMRAGVPRDDAIRRARMDFGGVDSAKEGVRSAGWDGVVDGVLRDLHYAFRNLRASPGYAALAIGTLSVGMALTTCVLTAANTVLRERWAVADPSRVYMVLSARGGPGFTPASARFIGERAADVGAIVAARCVSGLNDDCVLDMNGATASVDLVSGNYFAALRVPVQLGRGFVGDEDQIDDPRAVVVISDAAWRARFAADPSIVGRQIRIDDVPFTVVGVAGPGFIGTRTEPRDAWVPMAAMLALRPNRPAMRQQLTTPSPDASEVAVAVRLAPGVSPGRAQAQLDAVAHAYRVANGLEDRGTRLAPSTLFPNPGKQRIAAAMFALMFVASALVLLLACANVGNLLLARATARGREISIRLALGASRGRVVRQLLIESGLLAVASGGVGIAIAYRLPAAIMSGSMGALTWHFVPDAAVFAAAFALTAITCVAFGLAPALHATRADVSTVFKGGGAAARGGRRISLRSALLAVQIAVSVVLLVNAGLLIRSLEFGRDHDIGFQPAGVTTVAVTLPASYDSARMASFARGVMDQRTTFGTPKVAFVREAPLDRGQVSRIRLPGEAERVVHMPWIVEMSPGTLGLLGMPLVAGRDLNAANDDDAVLVNESLARILWPGEQPLGKTIMDGGERRVVGVVKDGAMYRLDRVEGVLFRPLRMGRVPVVLLRDGSPASIQAITTIAQRLDPLARVQTDSLTTNVDRQLGPSRIAAELASVLGALALLLATVGVFGVFSFVVQQRTREIGIRAALGASSRHVLAVVVRDNLRATTVGLIVGFIAAAGAGRLLENQMSALYGVSIFDPVAFGGTAALLVIAGLAATLAPARRATRVDPMIALRHE